MNREKVSALVSERDIFHVSNLTEQLNRGSVREVYVAPEMGKRVFRNLIKYGIGPGIRFKDIAMDDSQTDGKDISFAWDFGYVMQRISGVIISEQGVDAWTGPTLIPQTHPLAGVINQSGASVSAREGDPIRLVTKLKAILPKNIISAYYLRITVDDEPMVLAQVCQELANREINICELRQPGNFREEIDPLTGFVRRVEISGEPVDIAFLLDPSKRVQVETAVESIRQLPVVRSVNALFRVIGNPTQDLSNKN